MRFDIHRLKNSSWRSGGGGGDPGIAVDGRGGEELPEDAALETGEGNTEERVLGQVLCGAEMEGKGCRFQSMGHDGEQGR